MTALTLTLSKSDDVLVHYEAGFIVLSYFISWVGCISSLELLCRRTSVRGAFNWYLLIASSIAMGGVGIWSMHFVGNRATVLDDGSPSIQLLYNPGFTALSFFLPIIVLLLAFHLLAVTGKPTKINTFVAGLLTGTAVCAMHYVGQQGIANYDCTYRISNVVGAAIIAIVASLVALGVTFQLRETWTDSWWKKALCAALLACAVSGMHWTAAVGTVYRFRPHSTLHGNTSRVQTVIFCAVLSLVACVVLLAIAFVKRRRVQIHRRRAQELVLACAYFDESDRVMISHDGFLPYQKITNQFVRKTFAEDELGRSHPAFIWVYEASRNWATLKDLIPGMQDQLDRDPVARSYQPGHENSIDLARTASADFSTVFKQLFCIAAERLADQLHQSIESLGVMFEEPLETGAPKSNQTIQERFKSYSHIDMEKGGLPTLLGNGRYLFLNRRLTRSEAADFAALGYRFGSTHHVAETLARNMQVENGSIMAFFTRMKICVSREHLHPAGVHLACFLLRPNVHAGFDVLVPTVSQNQLPLMTLSVTQLTLTQEEVVRSLDELTVREILRELITEEVTNTAYPDKNFRWQLYSTFVRLVDTVNDHETMMAARFSAKAIQTPSRGTEESGAPATCTLFSVRYLGTIHSSYSQKDLIYVPFDFFNAQQGIDSSDEVRHETFKKEVQTEFSTCLEQRPSHSSRGPTLDPSQSTVGLEQANTTRSNLSSWPGYRILTVLGLAGLRPPRRSLRSPMIDSNQSDTESAEHKKVVETIQKQMNISAEVEIRQKQQQQQQQLRPQPQQRPTSSATSSPPSSSSSSSQIQIRSRVPVQNSSSAQLQQQQGKQQPKPGRHSSTTRTEQQDVNEDDQNKNNNNNNTNDIEMTTIITPVQPYTKKDSSSNSGSIISSSFVSELFALFRIGGEK